MSFLSKLMDIVGQNDQDNLDEYDYEYDAVDKYSRKQSVPAAESSTSRSADTRVKGSKVVGMPNISNGSPEMVLIEPCAFEEMTQVIDVLRQQKSVILNMTLICQEEAQRAVDFVAGGTYAIDGHYERIGDNIFLFTPSSVQVSTSNRVMTEVITAPVNSGRSVSPDHAWARESIAQ